MTQIKDAVAPVTGGNRGLGRAVSECSRIMAA